MAIVKSYSSSASQSEGRPVHYVVDLTSELPTSPNIGDTAFCKQTNYFMKSQDGATWTNQGGGAGAADFADLTGTASVAQGGTGASNAAGARTALGLGSLATASSVAFSDVTGSLALGAQSGNLALNYVSGTLAIVNGGTGQSNISSARTALGLGTAATANSGDFATSVHTHPISDVTSLQTSLDGKAASSHTHVSTDITGTMSVASGGTGASNASVARTNLGLGTAATSNSGDFATASHTHGQSDITSLVSDLAGKAASAHTHALATDVTGTLSMAQGGTGQSNAADIRTALGLGSLATQSSVAASSLTGSLSLITQSGLLPGATGISGLVSTANLGSGTGTDSKFLKGDQTWATPSAGSVAAADITGSLSLITQSGLLPLTRGVLETLAVMNGGTGAANATSARSNLGLGTLATQNSVAFSDVTGSISLGAQSGDLQLTDVSGTLAMVNGGTGASNASVARTNLGLGSLATASSIILTTDTTGTLSVGEGGTNASNAADARTNLGLGSIATLSSVTLVTNTAGTLSVAQGGTGASSGSAAYTNLGAMGASNLSGTVAIVNGGTGQANANSALNALLPSQSGNSGKYLTTDGTNASWGTVVGGSPFTTVRKTGLDQGSSGTSLLNSVNQMDFTLASNTNYVFEYWIRYQTAANTTGLVLGLQTAQTPVGLWMNWETALASTGTLTGGSAIGSNTTLSIASGNVSSGGVQLAYLTGMVMGGGTGGTMALRWCSEVTGSMCTIKTGTMGRIMAIT